jgi:putative transposase
MGHTYLRLLYHIVFGTKRRTPSLTADLESELYPYLEGIIHRRGGWLLALGGMPDHVHLLVHLKADLHVAEMVRLLKSNSSKWIHERPRPVRGFAWQTGYAAFTVSESQEEDVREYILRQKEHHRKTSFEDELKAFLRKHRIEFDPDHLLD